MKKNSLIIFLVSFCTFFSILLNAAETSELDAGALENDIKFRMALNKDINAKLISINVYDDIIQAIGFVNNASAENKVKQFFDKQYAKHQMIYHLHQQDSETDSGADYLLRGDILASLIEGLYATEE